MDPETVQKERTEVEKPVVEVEEAEEKKKAKEEESEAGGGVECLRVVLAILVFPIFAFLIISLVIGFLAIFGSDSSPSPSSISTSMISLPSQCKILSSSVDLRSSKVCELGLLNYKAKHVFYSPKRNRFRCRYDYYWASVFQVEYLDPALSQTRFALAEAPEEALPLSCRPNFSVAWLTKDKFKVNETYDCWYTSGLSKVSLYRDGFFSCQAKDPSPVEMTRRYFFLLPKILQSWFVREKTSSLFRWGTLAGVLSGFATSLISISFVSALQLMKSWFRNTYVARKLVALINTIFFRRACFLVAYFSVVSWLTFQYWKRLGLPEVYRVYNH